MRNAHSARKNKPQTIADLIELVHQGVGDEVTQAIHHALKRAGHQQNSLGRYKKIPLGMTRNVAGVGHQCEFMFVERESNKPIAALTINHQAPRVNQDGATEPVIRPQGQVWQIFDGNGFLLELITVGIFYGSDFGNQSFKPIRYLSQIRRFFPPEEVFEKGGNFSEYRRRNHQRSQSKNRDAARRAKTDGLRPGHEFGRDSTDQVKFDARCDERPRVFIGGAIMQELSFHDIEIELNDFVVVTKDSFTRAGRLRTEKDHLPNGDLLVTCWIRNRPPTVTCYNRLGDELWHKSNQKHREGRGYDSVVHLGSRGRPELTDNGSLLKAKARRDLRDLREQVSSK